MLEASNIHVRFGGLVALQDVSLALPPGTVVGLVGPNGAGKSTLLNVLGGILPAHSGRIRLDGADIAGYPVERRATAGLARSFQTPRVDPTDTARHALRAACHCMLTTGVCAAVFRSPRQRREERRIRHAVDELLAAFSLQAVADAPVGSLPTSKLRMLEVARIAALKPRYALLDEPAAGLDEEERGLVAHHIRALCDRGVGVALIEHNFPFVSQLADRVIVLTQGRILTEGTPDDIRSNPQVAAAYLGDAEPDVH
jgi:branched-chain amino acid transport system ATP-binding protein